MQFSFWRKNIVSESTQELVRALTEYVNIILGDPTKFYYVGVIHDGMLNNLMPKQIH